ncbi:MAG: sigma-70 family RNA polymerase sigma factor, partial [Flavobacteriales bacterium]|nr:sigma-70 family RNA polymerase sigma factor [Flavobacteriales bacterium]
QAILPALAEQSRIVRLPLNKIGSINKINKAYSFLEQTHERPPSAQEIAHTLDLSVNEVKQSMRISGRHVSMDAPFKEGETASLYDVVQSSESPRPDANLMNDSLNIEVNRALDMLSEKESIVIRHYFGINNNSPMSLQEIGDSFGLTRERVRQIKEKGIRRLRHTSKSKVLKTYLG